MEDPKFGTAGAGDLFYSRGYKHSQEVPLFLAEMGLTAFEYQCGRGVRIGSDKAALLGENAREKGIALSIHAPYYISLSTEDSSKKENNLRYFWESAVAARAMGATRVVFHPGGAGKNARGEAFGLAQEALAYMIKELRAGGFGDILFCPETMGKINQLGDLAETIAFCRPHENLLPCVDFGHLNARTQGSLSSKEAYAAIFEEIANARGEEAAKNLHCHFSKIEYSAAGEKKHLTFEDSFFGPAYEPLMALLYEKKYTPVIICESAGTQAEDAKAMSKAYFDLTNQ